MDVMNALLMTMENHLTVCHVLMKNMSFLKKMKLQSQYVLIQELIIVLFKDGMMLNALNVKLDSTTQELNVLTATTRDV